MTKEQILQKHFTAEFGHDGHGKFMQYILDAMEEYAQQQVKNLNIPAVSGSLHLVDFIEEIGYMQGLYSNARYTQAEATRDKLAEQLDDLMRLGSNDR